MIELSSRTEHAVAFGVFSKMYTSLDYFTQIKFAGHILFLVFWLVRLGETFVTSLMIAGPCTAHCLPVNRGIKVDMRELHLHVRGNYLK